jgi:hypothetical protein
MPSTRYGGLSFREQVAFFRDKVNVPTAAWTDVWQGMHARAFVVAGALREDLLTDLRGAVDQAIAEGTTLAAFRRDFDRIVATHGWSYRGGRGWRSRVIYDTNLRTSYQAGRYAQLRAVRAARPYWRYRHSDAVTHPRPEHQAWDGLILSADDPWWQTHYPPNGWGCQCTVEALAERDLRRLGKDGPDRPPPLQAREVSVGVRGPTPRTVQVPEGIDPGWAYNVGEAAWGRELCERAMAQYRAGGRDAWELLTPAGPERFGRPAQIPADRPSRGRGRRLRDEAGVQGALREILDGEERVYRPGGLAVLVNAQALARHVDPNRGEFLPLLDDVLSDPFEVWLAFERHRGTGQVVMRSRVLKLFDLGRDRGVLVVANARRGLLEAWTVVPTSDLRYLQRQRRGMLLYGR